LLLLLLLRRRRLHLLRRRRLLNLMLRRRQLLRQERLLPWCENSLTAAVMSRQSSAWPWRKDDLSPFASICLNAAKRFAALLSRCA